MTSTPTLKVAELFGPTIQGEGPSAGQRAVFVRLSGCNLACIWCDTPYTWDWEHFDQASESRQMSVDAVADWATTRGADLVVITGGEPLMQSHTGALVISLTSVGLRVEIETNGTVAPSWDVPDGVTFNVSPKLAGSGMPRQRRIRPRALRYFRDSGSAVFKFVIASPEDVQELEDLERELDLSPVWVMPEGRSRAGVLGCLTPLADHAVARGWNITCRLHTLIWGDARGH